MKSLRPTFEGLLFVLTLMLTLCIPCTAHAATVKSGQFSVLSSNYATYENARLWLNCTVQLNDSEILSSSTFRFFLTDKMNETTENAIVVGDSISADQITSTLNSLTAIRQSKLPGGIFIEDLPEGEYFIGCEMTTEDGKSFAYTPFHVFESPSEYIKAGLDILISSYHDTWFRTKSKYVGLGKSTDEYGNDWEAWIFTALGSKYPYKDQPLDFSVDGSFLKSFDGKTYFDQLYGLLKKLDQNGHLKDTGTKDLFKWITAIAACGGDPRNFHGYNLVDMMIQYAYNKDGTPAIDDAGHLTMPDEVEGNSDILFLSYELLGLEIAGATPTEGYTDAIKTAGINSIVSQYGHTDPNNDSMAIDYYAMALLPLALIDADSQDSANCQQALETFKGFVVNEYLSKNGAILVLNDCDQQDAWRAPNANTAAVTVNTLVLAGMTAEDLGSGDFQKEYGSLLTSLCGEIVDGGVLYGGIVNRMATYQTLGALVDLYNGKSCFEIAAEKYRKNYPQYFTGQEEAVKPEAQKPQTQKPAQDPKVKYTPAKAKITKLIKGKKSFRIKWKKTKNASGYQVQYSPKKNFRKSVKTIRIGKFLKKGRKIGKLKSKKKYYVRIRAYRKIGSRTYYGKWSKVRSVKTK